MLKPELPPPPKEALEYLRAKGYAVGWDYRDIWKTEHVRAFTVAKAMSMDLLKDIRQAVDQALANGVTFHEFKKQLEPQLAKAGWPGKALMPDGSIAEFGTPRRLKIIYDTNLRVARTAGQWERIQRNKKAMPYLAYGLGPSREHRTEHVGWSGLVLPIDDPFWDTHLPPNGWGCKCRVRQITKQEAESQGGPSTPPQISYKHWTNKRSGTTDLVPDGIDPGWNYNPGKARLNWAKQYEKEKGQEFKKVVGTPGKPAKPPKRIAPSAFSTVPGVTADGIESVIRGISGNDKQIERLEAFMEAKKVKVLIVKQAEMSRRSRAANAIRDDVLEYLSPEFKRYGVYNYTIDKPRQVGGFTSASFNHLVIKAGARENLKRALKDPDIQKKAVKQAASNRTEADEPLEWAIGDASQGIDDAVKELDTVATWAHELGHQIHYYAGAPAAPDGAKYLTRYSKYGANNGEHYEYHAEHFAAWLFNRQAYAKFDPIGAQHFDDLIEQAMKGTERKR